MTPFKDAHTFVAGLIVCMCMSVYPVLCVCVCVCGVFERNVVVQVSGSV